MTPDELDRLLADRGARIATERARQADALKAARVGPWAPSLVAMKPRRRKVKPANVTPIRRRA